MEIDGKELPPRVVFFDGVCVFCHDTTRWLMAQDPEAKLHYAPLQGETAAALRALDPAFPESIDTLVFADLRGSAPRLLLRSAAILEALETISFRPWWLQVLRALPTPLADFLYGCFVRIRYRVFGKLDACPMPTAEERELFLD